MIYKITFDIENTDLNRMVSVLSKYKMDSCFYDGCLYIYYPRQQQYANCILMRESKIKNYFIQEIKERPKQTPTNFIQAWIIEKFNEEEKTLLEEQKQKELQQMMDNINKVREELKNNKNKEATADE